MTTPHTFTYHLSPEATALLINTSKMETEWSGWSSTHCWAISMDVIHLLAYGLLFVALFSNSNYAILRRASIPVAVRTYRP